MSDSTEPEEHVSTDGGAAETHSETNYLEREVNILKPSTPFMRDHLRVVWAGFIAWVLIVFGPVTLTFIAPDMMTSTMPLLGFPLHYFLVAIGAPGGALLLSVWYARRRGKLDEKYGIEHETVEETGGPGGPGEEPTAADGGVEQ